MTMLSWYFAGQEVVCVDDRPHIAGDDIAARLRMDQIYTIREVTLDDLDTRVGFLLVEVINQPCDMLTKNGAERVEPSYASRRFRPLRATAIESLRSLLSPTPESVDVLEDEEVARIEDLVARGTWPDRWSGDEPTADAWLDTVHPDGSVQALLAGFA